MNKASITYRLLMHAEHMESTIFERLFPTPGTRGPGIPAPTGCHAVFVVDPLLLRFWRLWRARQPGSTPWRSYGLIPDARFPTLATFQRFI